MNRPSTVGYRRNRDERRLQEKRSRLEQIMTYKKLKDNIPAQWVLEELNLDNVVDSKCLLNYLQNYGPLSALIFQRT